MHGRIGARTSGVLAVLAVALPLTPVTAAASASAPRAAPKPARGAVVGAWLGEINEYRLAAGLVPVTRRADWETALAKHVTYLDATPPEQRSGSFASAHTENPASPYYSPDGEHAGESANIGFAESSGLAAVDDWFRAPFHAIGMLRPGLRQVAMARSGAGTTALDVLSGLHPGSARTRAVLFPGPGVTTNLSSFTGESPDPLETCGWQGTTAGLPIVALLPAAASAAVTASVTGAGAEYRSDDGTACIVDESTYRSTDSVYGPSGLAVLHRDHAVLVIPRAPLTDGSYTVRISSPGQPSLGWTFAVATGATEAVLATPTRPTVPYGGPVRVTATGTPGSRVRWFGACSGAAQARVLGSAVVARTGVTTLRTRAFGDCAYFAQSPVGTTPAVARWVRPTLATPRPVLHGATATLHGTAAPGTLVLVHLHDVDGRLTVESVAVSGCGQWHLRVRAMRTFSAYVTAANGTRAPLRGDVVQTVLSRR